MVSRFFSTIKNSITGGKRPDNPGGADGEPGQGHEDASLQDRTNANEASGSASGQQ